jgi:hypothetical protein
MELVLILASIASFFALVVTWTMMPTSQVGAATAPSSAPSPQAAA